MRHDSRARGSFRTLICVLALLATDSRGASAGPQRAALRPDQPVPTSAADQAPPDLQQILAEAQRVQEADVAAWSRYRFSRRTEREDLDDSGEEIGRAAGREG